MKPHPLAALLAVTTVAHAQPHPEHHALKKHNLVLFGEAPLFASHIVYKAPHNFEVILKIELPAKVVAAYARARRAHPGETLIFLLDEMHIGDIQAARVLTGTLLRQSRDGLRTELTRSVRVDAFEVLYFNELPLSLAPD